MSSREPAPQRWGQGRRRAALAAVCAVLFLTFLDTTIVSVTLADIPSGLHAGVSALQWVVDAYALVFARLMLTGGTLGDLFGRKRVMLAGGGSLLRWFRALRLGPERWGGHRGPGRHGGGGRGLRAGYRLRDPAAVSGTPHTLDGAGRPDAPGLGLGAALATGIYGVIAGESAGYTAWWIVALVAVAVLSGAAFLVVESRSHSPAVDLSFFRKPSYTVANVVAVALLGAMVTAQLGDKLRTPGDPAPVFLDPAARTDPRRHIVVPGGGRAAGARLDRRPRESCGLSGVLRRPASRAADLRRVPAGRRSAGTARRGGGEAEPPGRAPLTRAGPVCGAAAAGILHVRRGVPTRAPGIRPATGTLRPGGA